MSDDNQPLAIGQEFPRGKLRMLGGAQPSFSRPLTAVEFWDPTHDPEHRRLRRLAELQRSLGDRVALLVLTPEHADEELLPDPPQGLSWAEIETDHEAAFGLVRAMLFDRNRRLVWRGPEAALEGTLGLIEQGKLPVDRLLGLAATKKRFEQLESSFRDDSVDQEDTCELALSILDVNPADTDVLERALGTAQSFGLSGAFWSLAGRVRPEYLDASDACHLAASLIDPSHPALRAPRVALALVEHHKQASFDGWCGPLLDAAEVYAFVGDFAEALRLLEQATRLDEDDEENAAGALAVMRERAGLAARRG